MSAVSQLGFGALIFNDKTGEPYLPLRRHENVVLTPFRPTDVPEIVAILSDESVYKRLDGPPYPYKEEHAISWIKDRELETEKAIRDIQSGSDEDGNAQEPKLTDACIVHAIRFHDPDGTEPFIGSVTIGRPPAYELGSLNGEEIALKNNSRAVGDPDIIWTIGYYLSSAYQGKGIMSDAAETLLHDWAVPVMGVRKMVGTVQEGNIGSIKIYEKLGFVKREGELIESAKWKGAQRYVFDWEFKG